MYVCNIYIDVSTVDKSLLFKGDFQMDSFTFNFYSGEPSLVSAACNCTCMHMHARTHTHTHTHTQTQTHTQTHTHACIHVHVHVHTLGVCANYCMYIQHKVYYDHRDRGCVRCSHTQSAVDSGAYPAEYCFARLNVNSIHLDIAVTTSSRLEVNAALQSFSVADCRPKVQKRPMG